MNKLVVIIASSMLMLAFAVAMLAGAIQYRDLNMVVLSIGCMIVCMFIDLVAIIWVAKEEIIKAIDAKG